MLVRRVNLLLKAMLKAVREVTSPLPCERHQRRSHEALQSHPKHRGSKNSTDAAFKHRFASLLGTALELMTGPDFEAPNPSNAPHDVHACAILISPDSVVTMPAGDLSG
jgi:hypothetical protein